MTAAGEPAHCKRQDADTHQGKGEFIMKKLMALALILAFAASLLCLPTSAAAKTIKADPEAVGEHVREAATGGLLFITIGFDEYKIERAINIQSMEQLQAQGLPTALYDATQENFYINGTSLKDYCTMTASEYIFMVHFEKYGDRTYLAVFWDPNSVPGCTINDTIEFGVADGFITKEMYKVSPFKATWNPTTKVLTVTQGFEPPAATTTEPPVTTTTAAPPATTSSHEPDASSDATSSTSDSRPEDSSSAQESSNAPVNASNATTGAQGGEKSNNVLPIVILVIVIVLVLAGAGVAIFFVLRGKGGGKPEDGAPQE